MSLLGVDLGSSQCKALAFSTDGRPLAAAESAYAPDFPRPGFVEIAPTLFWEAVQRNVREVAAAVAESDPVEALAISTHGETLVPVDARGEALDTAIMNIDNRALAEATWFEQQLGKQRIFALTGTVVHPMFPLPKIGWLKAHDPERFRATARFSSAGDYLLGKMGLPPYIDYSLASRFMAFDIRKKEWSAELLALAELSTERLAIPVPAGTVAGRLAGDVAKELNLPEGTLVAVGGHDQPCGALGVGVTTPGMVSDSLGTYECLVAVGVEPTLGETALSANLNSYCHVVPEHYITIAFFPSGMMTKWFVDLLATPESGDTAALYAELEREAPPGPTSLCITPHLIGSCTPHWDPRATGVICGLTPSTGRSHLYKGILEGLACELAINVEILRKLLGPFDTVRVTGGGTRSALGLQLRAALTGARLETLECREAVCLGAGLLAGVAAGVYADMTEAVSATVRLAAVVEPDERETQAYQPQLQQYRQLYSVLSALREDASGAEAACCQR